MKQKLIYIVSLILMLTFINISNEVGFAESVEESMDEIYSETLDGQEVEGLSESILAGGDLISPYSTFQKPILKPGIGGLAGRSTYVGTVKAGKQYHNSGNYSSGLKEMNALGGRGEVVPIVDSRGNIIKWRKDGADGTAIYYKSTSETDGLSRWTITFPGYKIRFMGM